MSADGLSQLTGDLLYHEISVKPHLNCALFLKLCIGGVFIFWFFVFFLKALF